MKKLITEDYVISAYKRGERSLQICKNCVVTPLAWDRMKRLGITVATEELAATQTPAQQNLNLKVIIGGDHTSFDCRRMIIDFLKLKEIVVEDAGSFSNEACDYPDFAKSVALSVQKMEFGFGILVDATGIPSAITANKFKGIRAATCYNEFSARSAREHNNANILVLGAKTLGDETIKSIIDTWLATGFGGERHQRRLDKISKIEDLNFRG